MVLKRLVVPSALILFLVAPSDTCAQYNKSIFAAPSYRMWSWLGELEWLGTGIKYSKFESGSILKGSYTRHGKTYLNDGDLTVSTINLNAALHYMHSKRLAFELGTGITRTWFDATDKPYFHTHPDATGDAYFEFSSTNLRTFLGIQYYAPFNKNKNFYVAMGPVLYRTIGASHRVSSSTVDYGSGSNVYSRITRYNEASGETLQADIEYPKNPLGTYFELGWMSKKTSKLAIYFRYYHVPAGVTMYYTNYKGTVPQYSDIGHFTLSSLNLLMNFRVGNAFSVKQVQGHAQQLPTSSARHVNHSSHKGLTTQKKYGRLVTCIGGEQDGSSTLWLYKKHGQYSLQRLDSNLSQLSFRKLDLLPKGHHKKDKAILIGYSVEDDLITISYDHDARHPQSIKIVANRFRLDGRKISQSVVLDINHTTDVRSRLLESAGGKLCIVSLRDGNRLHNSSIRLRFFDRNLGIIDTATYVFDRSDNGSQPVILEDALLNEYGEVFVSGEMFDPRVREWTGYIWMYDPVLKEFRQIQNIIRPRTGIHMSTDSAGNIFLSSFYSDPQATDRGTYRGVYLLRLDRLSKQIDAIQTPQIPEKIEEISKLRRAYITKDHFAVDYPNGQFLISRAISRENLSAFYHSPLVVDIGYKGSMNYATSVHYRGPVFGAIPARRQFGYWYDVKARELRMAFYGNATALSLAGNDSIDYISKPSDIYGPVILSIDKSGKKTFTQVANKSYKIKWRLQPYVAADGSVYFWGKKKRKYVILKGGKRFQGK